MDLKTYLTTSKKTQQQFAVALDVSQGLVWQWLNGVTRVTAERCLDIEKATDGQVTRYDLRPDIFGKKSRAA